MMRLAEGKAKVPHQIVGKVGGCRKALFKRRPHVLRVRRHIGHHAGCCGNGDAKRVSGVKDAFLVLLHVLAIGQRQTFQDNQQSVQRADDPPRLGTHQLGGVGVALLRHDRRSGGEGIGQADKAEPVGAPDDHLLGKAGHMHRTDRRRAQKLQREVTVRYRIHGIRHRPLKAQKLGCHVTVGRKAGAGQRRRAKRRFIQARTGIGKTAAVAPEHFDIGHQVKAERHRLGGLKMGESRHQRVGMLFGAAQKRVLERCKRGIHRINQLAYPQPEIGRHLVIARPGRMQAARRLADQFGKPRLDIHVNVFEGRGKTEAATGDLAGDAVQPAMDRVAIRLGDDAAGGQHAGMRTRSGDVLPVQPLVIIDRGVDLLHQLRGSA